MDPTGIRAVVPSLLQKGEECELRLKVLGPVIEIPSLGGWSNRKPALRGQFNLNASRNIQYRDNCLPEWTGELELDGGEGYEGPSRILFDGREQGVFPGDTRPIKSEQGLRWTIPGFHFVRLTDHASGVTALSNPVYVSAERPAHRIYWGDPHWQTFFSDGIRCPEELYAFARDEAFLDFGALTDHVEALTDRQWDYFVTVTNDYDQPGRFATLVGLEWTRHPEFGHRNVYYRGNNGPCLRATDPRYDTLEKLWAALEGIEAVAIPHHTSNKVMGVDWEAGWNPRYEKSVEIHSVWGSSECSEADGNIRPIRVMQGEVTGHHVVDALRRGYRLGFVGGGDIHDGRPGDDMHTAQNTDGGGHKHLLHPQGFTAAMAASLSRENIYDAIKSRHTYATTRSRIYLKADVRLDSGEYVLDVQAASEDGIREAVLIHNGDRALVIEPEGDPEVLETSRRIGRMERGDFCYLRIVTRADNLAWSSPVWIEE